VPEMADGIPRYSRCQPSVLTMNRISSKYPIGLSYGGAATCPRQRFSETSCAPTAGLHNIGACSVQNSRREAPLRAFRGSVSARVPTCKIVRAVSSG